MNNKQNYITKKCHNTNEKCNFILIIKNAIVDSIKTHLTASQHPKSSVNTFKH